MAIDKLQWVNDLTIPDGKKVTPNEKIGDKIWEIRNSGATTWGAGYVLVHEAGDPMSAPNSVALPPLAPNAVGQITVPSIIAPATVGDYKATWAAHNAAGQKFPGNLTIEIKVVKATGVSPLVAAIVTELSGYGITFEPDNWEDENAKRVRDMIVQVGQRLYDFAIGQQIPAATLVSPQDVFRRFYPRRVLRRNPDQFKYFDCADPNDHKTCSKAYAWNDGIHITFYSKAIFTGTQSVTRQSPVKRFAITFTTEFLVLHELSHSHTWVDEFVETSRPLINMVAAAVPDHKQYSVDSNTIASAGFKQGARSLNNHDEYSTDAIANWCMKSFTSSAEGDTEGFGDFRQNQMDKMVANWLKATYP